MKRIAAMCAAAFAAFEAFGIGATQEWVRRHVADALAGVVRSSSATNIDVIDDIPAASFAGGDTNATYRCAIRAGIGGRPALKVVSSTVAEIPAGTFYMLNPDGDYVNRSNPLIAAIHAAPYTVEGVATNSAGGVSTNLVRMGRFWAADSTNGVWRMGLDGDTCLYLAGNRSVRFAIRSTTLPDRASAVLLSSAAPSVSWIRAALSLAVPSLNARTTGETVYTVNSESTMAIGTITFTRVNRFGKASTVTFTPRGLQGVYRGPSGPFVLKAEAEAAARDLDNWNFGDWDSIWNVEGFGRMTRAEFESSDVWRQLVAAIGTDRTEAEVSAPQMPPHPCPAPDDFWVFDSATWENPDLSDEVALASAWKVNARYSDGKGGYDRDALDEWRGRNGCRCGVEGCANQGVAQHREGRVRKGGDGVFTYSDDVDGGDGCKCCVRCMKYGADTATLVKYNDHRAAGEGAGECRCGCGVYTTANESSWPQDFHNIPAHTLAWPSLDYSCMCYCSKDKALDGGYVRHAKYAGDSPWCKAICSRCGMVDDRERYITHSYPAFDTRHVSLRAAKWSDHTPRAEAEAGSVSALADPTYSTRCGCACGAYDTANGGALPSEFADFHQFGNAAHSCLCTCGQVHRPNRVSDSETAAPWPCNAICAVCLKVEGAAEGSITVDGVAYPRHKFEDPDGEAWHTPSSSGCGCLCYNGTYGGAPSRHSWSIGLGATDSDTLLANLMPKWHRPSASGCGCKCGGYPYDRTDLPAFHAIRNAAVPCRCQCLRTHPGYSQSSKCRVCAVCGTPQNGDEYAAESFHVLKEGATDDAGNRICRCWCGVYSSEIDFVPEVSNTTFFATAMLPSANGPLHDFDGSEVRGVTNCLCVCGAKHVFREPTTYWKNQHHDEWCEGVCQSCRRRLKDGRPAAESDHTPKPRSKRRCGCRCGWFGVDQEHTDGGREAKTQRMHPQCMVNNTGDPSSPPYCKCFGTGNGGRWHYHEPFPDSSCPAVCQYLATGDSSLGHLAAGEPSPTSGGTRPATAAHHKGKAYGCGCRCGRCGEKNRPDWKGNDALHRPAQNAADQCHCSCESRRLVGSGKGGHEFAGTSCTCTCGKTHRSSLNACGLCLGGDGSTSCGKIHRNGELLEDTADNHRFDSGSCTCRCGLHTRAHDWGDDWRGEPTTTYCPRCGAQLDRYPMWRTCKRCGLQEQTGGFQYSGAHRDGCTETGGDETTPPAVDECGECGHIAPGHYPSCSQYASGDQGETDDTGSIGEI